MSKPRWKKASFCDSCSDCVEVRKSNDNNIIVRDSKNPDGPTLSFSQFEWRAFIKGAKVGEFDLLK